MINHTRNEINRLNDSLKEQIKVLENKTIEKINNITLNDMGYIDYKKDKELAKELTGFNVKQVIISDVFNREQIKKYEFIIKKAKKIFDNTSVFNANSKIKEFLELLNKTVIPRKFNDLNDKLKDKIDVLERRIYPPRNEILEKIEEFKEQKRHSLKTLLNSSYENHKKKINQKILEKDKGLSK